MQLTLSLDAQLAAAINQAALNPSLAVERYVSHRSGTAGPPLPARGARITLSLTPKAGEYIRETAKAAHIPLARAARDVLLFALNHERPRP